MASPNLLSIVSVVGNTAVANVSTAPFSLVQNSVSSDSVIKIGSLLISNMNGISAADIDVDIYRSSIPYYVVKSVSVPADTTLDVLSKSLYLNEGDTLRVRASANSMLQAVCSYEILS